MTFNQNGLFLEMAEKISNNMRRIESIMKLMKTYRINVVDFDGIRLEKVYHDPIQHEDKTAARDNPDQNAWINPLGAFNDKY